MKIETVNQGDILEEAIKTYGVESQVNMAIEECAELINALEKYRRNRRYSDYVRSTRDNIWQRRD